jgi:hypothetical protein
MLDGVNAFDDTDSLSPVILVHPSQYCPCIPGPNFILLKLGSFFIGFLVIHFLLIDIVMHILE